MKRSPMPRPTKPMTRKTPMNRANGIRIGNVMKWPKRKAPRYPSSAQLKDRTAWAKQFPTCWLTGKMATDTHEIASRGTSPLKWAHRCSYV